MTTETTSMQRPGPPNRTFNEPPVVALSSTPDGKIILDPDCWLQIGSRRWLYSHQVDDDFVFNSQHGPEPENLDYFDKRRVFSYSEMEALVYAGFLFMNKPTRLSLPAKNGSKPRGAEE